MKKNYRCSTRTSRTSGSCKPDHQSTRQPFDSSHSMRVHTFYCMIRSKLSGGSNRQISAKIKLQCVHTIITMMYIHSIDAHYIHAMEYKQKRNKLDRTWTDMSSNKTKVQFNHTSPQGDMTVIQCIGYFKVGGCKVLRSRKPYGPAAGWSSARMISIANSSTSGSG